MQFARRSERRGFPIKGKVIGLGLGLGLIVAGAVTYYSGALDTILFSDEGPPIAQAVVREPVTAPEVAPISMPIDAPRQDTPAPFPTILPVANFGEVLSEGLVQLLLPTGVVADTWYTFQVDTKSHEMTLLFALYNEPLDTIISTATVRNYTEGARLDKAEITLRYPNGPARHIWLDRVDGTIIVNQQYTLPYGPSMFSPELRLALVYSGINLYDESRNKRATLHLDLSGLSDGEALTFQDSAPTAVEDALNEIQELVSQIEDRRPHK
ncbi:MAG: hypothetical protein IIC96_01605 [Chloroflexi bacterium]|nr:hypothetical protein [Chloroflexota bacterium]